MDASPRAAALVEYLGLVAGFIGDHRKAGFEMLRLSPGAAVLDVGCGAGEVCIELAGMLGAGSRVVGVDRSRMMIEASRKAAAKAGVNVEFLVGSIHRIPFPDATFDAVRAERVFQHLENPQPALVEMIRVVRPGGRVMAIDPDHGQGGMALDEPRHRRVFEASLRALVSHVVNGHSGTRLRAMFQRAGLADVEQRVRSVDIDPRDFTRVLMLPERLAACVSSGEIGEDEAREFLESLDTRCREGTFFANLIAYDVAGTRPRPEFTSAPSDRSRRP